MALESRKSWKYIGTAAAPKGTMMKRGSNAGEIDISTAVTDFPAGILLEDVPADATRSSTNPANVGLGNIQGETYKVIASTTIAVNAYLGPTTAGKAVTVVPSTTYAIKWLWGIAVSAGGAGGTDYVEMEYMAHIVGQ